MNNATLMDITATVNNFEIWVYPKYAETLEGQFDATVEAEYGDTVVEGKSITLAHHGSRSKNPAPCIAVVDEPLKSGKILCSHLDLDAIGGVLNVIGLHPGDFYLWGAAAFIDVKGIHHIHELEPERQDLLNAWYAFNEGQREKYPFVPGEEFKANEQIIGSSIFI